MSSPELLDPLGILIQTCLCRETANRRPRKSVRRNLLNRLAAQAQWLELSAATIMLQAESQMLNAPLQWLDLGWRELALASALCRVGPAGHFR